ncbi:MAG: ABC transporter permease [Saprospiraceae bacterium]|jgi:ABC-2 type transport system permease protein|nr:ABC transporter permease [Saprospiraceae bacterium]MBK9992659.1 ABC transporter permease [Saprospiraceae bacterium]
MNKLGLIIQREYITRVKNKNFILTTLLTPLGFLLFFIAVIFIFSNKSDKVYKVAIKDESQAEIKLPQNTARINFYKSEESLAALKEKYTKKELDGILVLPKFAGVDVKNYSAYYYTDKSMNIDIESQLKKQLGESIKEHKMQLLAIEKMQLEKLKTDIEIDPEPVSESQKDKSSHASSIATMLGGAMGYIIFFIIFLYGAAVMRSVTDEKVNRIVELIISSTDAKTLMLGKIIGVGLVGLTQIVIWMILIPAIYILGISIAGIDAQQMQDVSQSMPNAQQVVVNEDEIVGAIREIGNLNWWRIVPVFILYFLGGYFIYAAMFAAIGAAVGDDINDSQSLTIIVTIPIMFAIYIMFQAIREPESGLTFFSTMFPLFSPIVMPAMMAFDPPWWQIGLSLVILFLFAYFIVLLTAKIYRVGILMYGKKASLKEIWKWVLSR